MNDVFTLTNSIWPYLGIVAVCFVISLLLTPLVARFAKLIGALDLPAHLRSRQDRTAERRIHTDIVPKFAGPLLMVCLILVLLTNSDIWAQSWVKGIFLGGLVIFAMGVVDDIIDIPGRTQLLFHLLAAVIVVMSGVSITFVQVAGIRIDLVTWSQVIQIGSFVHTILFPADLIAIIWIVVVINTMGWVDGLDGLHGSLTVVALLTILFILMRGSPAVIIPIALLVSATLGANLGFLPFNYNPAKMFYGSSGSHLNGFLLAVFALISSSKLAVAIVVLGLPLIDAALVVALRIKSHPEVLKNPVKILSISDKNHLHHRLLDVGYSKKMVLFIEVAIMSILGLVAFYFSGFTDDLLAIIGSISAIMIIFTLIGIAKRRAARIQEKMAAIEASKPVVEIKYNETGEKFTY